jgi:hypothetical protein
MDTTDIWTNEWAAISQAPHLVGIGIVAIAVIAILVAKWVTSFWLWIHLRYIRNMHEHCDGMPEAARKSEAARKGEAELKNDGGASPIEYHGQAGYSFGCEAAVLRLFQFGNKIYRVRILSCFDRSDDAKRYAGHHKDERIAYRRYRDRHLVADHALVLSMSPESQELVIIKEGFTSGYSGTGPMHLAFVLNMLHKERGIPVSEYEVDRAFMNRVNKCALTDADLKWLDEAKEIRPMRWYNYMYA